MKCLTKWLGVAALTIMAGLTLSMDAAMAQVKGGGHGGGYPGGRAPVSHGIYYGHPDWSYVVPHRSATYAGTYYSVGQARYYTPAPVVSVFTGQPNGNVQPPMQKPIELTFGSFARYRDLAGRLAMDVNALCLDMHHNYQGNKNFADAYAKAYGVLQAAKYLQGNEHHGDKEAIGRRVAEMHGLFHHVMNDTHGWTRTARKQVGAGALEENMAGVEAVLHYLAHDVGLKQNQPAHGAVVPAVDPGEVAPAPVGNR
ncbi:MAG: hypothetical protein K2X38_06555 [Gemmataceae bacterium]|nr:hypothetical protein [Gemmataceae bacterium]